MPTGNHPKAQRAEKGDATAPTEARRLLCMTRLPAKPSLLGESKKTFEDLIAASFRERRWGQEWGDLPPHVLSKS